jgi:outer membrane lipoprotein-sorting protein
MLRIALLTVVSVLIPATLHAALSETSGVDEILEALESRGKELQDFSANVTLTNADVQTGDAPMREGKVWFQKQPDDQTRIRVQFNRTTLDGKAVRPEKTEYLLEGKWLIDRNYTRKQEVKRQILKEGEKVDLLKLGEGPFPLPIGQSPDAVKKQFEVKQLDPKEEVEGEAPEGTLRLQLTPHDGTRLANKFSRIDVWVDIANSMPRRIEVVDRNETTIQTTDLLDLQLNTGLQDTDFQLPPTTDEWDTMVEAFEE